MDPLRVLLLSPVRGRDVASGDVVYTETLLSDPPENVAYETYDAALRRGTLRVHGTRAALRDASTLKDRVREASLATLRGPLGFAKRRGMLYREPVHLLSIAPGEYDVVHQHVFNTRFRQIDCPLVVSHALPLENLYRDAFGWRSTRAATVEKVERWLGRTAGWNMFSTGPLPQAARALALTPYVAEQWREAGVPADAIDLVPIYQPRRARWPTGIPRSIAFVANDFASKGGAEMLSAMETVKRAHPDVQLLVVGAERSAGPERLGDGVRWLGRVSRNELLRLFRETIDVLCHPTNFDGLPLVVLEALSHGIPAIVSDYGALPYMAPPALVVPQHDRTALCRTILDVLEPSRYAVLAAEATQLFEHRFSADAVRPRLRRVYDSAVDASR